MFDDAYKAARKDVQEFVVRNETFQQEDKIERDLTEYRELSAYLGNTSQPFVPLGEEIFLISIALFAYSSQFENSHTWREVAFLTDEVYAHNFGPKAKRDFWNPFQIGDNESDPVYVTLLHEYLQNGTRMHAISLYSWMELTGAYFCLRCERLQKFTKN